MKKIYNILKDRFLKCDKDDILIVTVPPDCSYYDMERLFKIIKTKTSNEHIIILPENINIESFSFDELKNLKEKIESIMVAKKIEQ